MQSWEKTLEDRFLNYQKAMDTIETMRAGLAENKAKMIFMSGKIFVYDELIRLL